MIITFCVLTAWNLTVFFMYGLDKWKSSRGKWRIKEQTLLLSAFVMGGFGAFFGMRLFRHKTKHKKFVILLPIAVILNMAIIAAVFYFSNWNPIDLFNRLL